MNPGTKERTALIKKMVPVLVLAIACCTGTQAQIRLGLLGGVHSSSVLETNHLPGWDTTTKKYNTSRSGVQLGIIVEMPIGHKGFFFQPALTYTSKGRKYAKTNDSVTSLDTDTVYIKRTLNLGYIEIPLNITYKIPLTANRRNSFFISAGPYIDFFYNGNVTHESLTQSTKKYTNESDPVTVGKSADTYKTADLGFNARAGFEMGNVMLSGYFSQGLTSFYNAPYQGTFHHQLFGVSLGIWLSSTNKPPARVKPKKDTDKDGVPDEEDMCPLRTGTAAWHGCPVPDTDRDGIDDEHDSCRTIPGLARYNGCPIPDSDGDGVNDEEDKCPHQVGLARYNGCPIPDRDGDGVNDEADNCPDSAGPVENHGCPIIEEIKKETTEEINYIARNILFTPASDKLTDSSFIALDHLAGLLLAYPKWHLTVEGYTDNQGTPGGNRLLSQKRATTVLNYLVRKGLAAKQLTATGLGQDHPIAGNTTAKGRAANRRVELKLSIEKQ
jgi:OOP family OmpA-OmpF porin